MAKANGIGNGNGDDKTTDWEKVGKTAGKVILGGIGGPGVEGVKAVYDYFNSPKDEPKATTPPKGGVTKGTPKTPSEQPKVEGKRGSLHRMPLQKSMGVEKQTNELVPMESKKAQPIEISRPERKVEKLPEAPKPKHKLSPKEVITNMKLGINHMRQLNERSREQ